MSGRTTSAMESAARLLPGGASGGSHRRGPGQGRGHGHGRGPGNDLPASRVLSLAGGAVLTLSYLAVLYHVVDVVGGAAGTGVLVLAVVGSVALAAVVSRVVGSRAAVALGALLLAVGLGAYLLAVPRAMIDLQRQFGDTLSLLSGMSVLRMTKAGVWALGFAPAPVFLSWYFLLRRAYGPGVLVGGAALGTFVLTGDVATVPALVGVLGGAAAAGFGRLEREGDDPSLRNTVLAVLVAMLVVTTSASLVPGGEAQPLLPDRGTATVETSLTSADASVDLVGSIVLSPEVRFTVATPEPRYWRVAAYDRYTGGGWVRTGEDRPYEGQLLSAPEAAAVSPLTHTFRAESSVATMPAAWKPVRFASDDVDARVTDLGGLHPRESLSAGDSYRVRSVVARPSVEALRRAGTDYPDAVEARYLALPESTPPRLSRFTSNLTADAETPLETAVTIERWLETNKAYSLDVDRPDGDVASAFVFEMDAGYCTYYATAMVAMLRSQGVPARFVVGYLPGQQVDGDRWVVRGYDSHAWVEVYFPDVGWIRFDPTPAGPRGEAERNRLAAAREGGEENVDTDRSAGVPAGETGANSSEVPAFGYLDLNASAALGGSNSSVADAGRAPGPLSGVPRSGDGGEETGPDPASTLYALVLALGAVTAAVRLGLPDRLYRELWIRRLPDGSPRERVEAVVDRAEYLLGRRYRPRRDDETRRAYVESLRRRGLNDRAARIFALGERARYAGRATETDARTAGRLLRDLRAQTDRVR